MSNEKKGGIGFLTVLLTVFVVLKLCGLVSWSWWWVLSPFWIPWTLIITIIALSFPTCKRKITERPR